MSLNSSIIKAAVEASKKSPCTDFKVGAVIFKQNRILSFGFNSQRSCSSIESQYKRFDFTLHAEAHAASKIKDRNLLKDASILIVRIKKDGTLSMAKPCEYCEHMIKSFNIKKVYYSTFEGEIVREKF